MWEEVRTNPAARPHLRAPWAPWWLGPVRRYPVHAGLFAILVALSVAVLAIGAEPVSALLCHGSTLAACRDGLRGLIWAILAGAIVASSVSALRFRALTAREEQGRAAHALEGPHG